MKNRAPYYWEAGPVPAHSGSDIAYAVGASNVGLTSPTVSGTVVYDETDPDAEELVTGTVVTGSASVSTTTWTTPLIGSMTAGKRYRVETTVSDSGNTHVFVLFVECKY